MSEKILNNVEPLLQADYGGTNDCTITSTTALIRTYLNNIYNATSIYNKVETQAKRYGYTSTNGFNPLFEKMLLTKIADLYEIKKTAHSGYMKNAGYTLKKIQKCIDNGNPVVLNLLRCGKYFDHTVLIYGYSGPVLYIYDNWTKEGQKIAYNDISCISSINWME